MKIEQVHSKGLKFNEALLKRFNEAPISEILNEPQHIEPENIERVPNRDIVKDGAEIYKFLTS